VAHALHHPYLFPAVPRFVLRAMLGELSSMVLEGSRVSNAKLVASGFEFRHPELKEALKGLLQ